MGRMELIVIVLALIGFAAMIYVPLIWLFWRTLNNLAVVTAGDKRASDRERRDVHDMLMRMIEAQGVGPHLAMQQHATERMERMALETSLQRDEIKAAQPAAGPVPVTGSPYTDDETLAIE
jgi:hypothetical protein